MNNTQPWNITNLSGTASFSAALASYVGNYGTASPMQVSDGGGVFHANSSINVGNLQDGVTQTFLAGERYNALGPAVWAGVHWDQENGGGGDTTSGMPNGTSTVGRGRHVLGRASAGGPNAVATSSPPGDPLQGFSSSHPGGCHMLMGDGSVKFISSSINNATWSLLGGRNDRVPVSEDF